MRNKLIMSIAWVAFSFAASALAFAADMPVKAPPPAPPPAPVYTWTGFYVGGTFGYAWRGDNVSVSETPGDPATQFVNQSGHQIVDPASMSLGDFNSAIGGVEGGYNWQFNQIWVTGLEADFSWADLHGSNSSGVNMAGFGPNFGTLNASEKVEWFGTVRGRLGYLIQNNVMLFATGGFAYGKVNEAANLSLTFFNTGIGFGISGFGFECHNPAIGGVPSTCFSGSQSQISTGWTVGGGAEGQITRNLTIKVEYLYVNLGNDTLNISAVNAGGATPSFLKVNFGDTTFNVVRAGVNWRF